VPMKRLERIFLVQFYLFDAEEVEIGGNTAWLGPNGAGKTSVLDAIQIVLLGAHQGYLKFNTQSVSTSHKRNHRSIRDYCLGTVMDNVGGNAGGEETKIALSHRRDVADTYITLVFRDDSTGEAISVGTALHAQLDAPDHILKGLYVLPGVELTLADHTETVGEDTVPLRWKDFEHVARSKCVSAGRTPEITEKAESYIREMLHVIQPRAKHINHREFMKAFKKSVTLRDIESVNDFVRDFLVEAHPIDKTKAIAQIEDFRRLDNLVKQTKEQITTLAELSKRYDKLATEHREVATMNYLVAHYEHESLTVRKGLLEDGELHEAELAKKANDDVDRLETLTVELRDQIAGMERELNSNPAARQATDLQTALDEAKKSRQPNHRTVGTNRLALAAIFERLNAVPGFRQPRPESEGMAVRLDELGRQAEPDAEKARNVLADAIGLVGEYRPWVEREHPGAKSARDAADAALRQALATSRALDQHGVRLAGSTASVIGLLAEHGIEATPVCSLVRVTQVEWQPAIEGYLKGNRESLVITGGREREAVRIIRQAPEAKGLFNVAVVQPGHLKQERWDDKDDVLVGSLVTGDNPVAVTYVRMLLGKTRRVRTEEELEIHPRSLTADGMLSANGSTRRIRLVNPGDFMIGTQVNDAEKFAFRRKIQEATDAYNKANDYFLAVDKAKQAVDQLGDTARAGEAVEVACGELKRLESKIQHLVGQLASFEEDGGVAALRASIADAKARCEAADAELKTAIGDQATHLANANRYTQDIVELQPKLKEALTAVNAAASHPDYDHDIVQRVTTEHDQHEDFPHDARRTDCLERRKKAVDRITAQLSRIMPEFDRFLTSANITLVDERQDWRRAREWVAAEHDRLEGTQLAPYEEDVARAKEAAEKAFREDVAVRISEKIQSTKNSLAELNKILDTCPPFSNGEKYSFEATPAEAYKEIYKYIVEASRGTDFFTGEAEASKTLLEYLQQSVDPERQKGPNPLDDYRLLFNFDLQIKKNGNLIGRLSQRVGPGSNGEHRTPFYVIAGAALASAYRIRSGETNTGAALMIIDEAFHGMDSQNSLAAARFLESLGLQLLIAAPDSELGKLMPICDTVYELMRFGQDVFMEPTYMKEAAHKLMTSDMTMEHPQLVLDKIAEIEAQP
jgi:ABC-type branched-subunit amino acid transport system ATPase component